MRRPAPSSKPMSGEDISTSTLPETASWIAIYEELASVLHSVVARSPHDPKTTELRTHLAWVQSRLAAWRTRHVSQSGLTLHRTTRRLLYGGKGVHLTARESELLDFLLRHPASLFTARQLSSLAWSSTYLSEAQVRTYIMRLRAALESLGLPSAITAVRGHGYGIDPLLGINPTAPPSFHTKSRTADTTTPRSSSFRDAVASPTA